MEFLPEAINKYTEDHTSPESEILRSLNRETWAKVLMPRMLSGHLQGRVLATFSHMIRPERILEIGTYTGYSALCLAEGLKDNGKLVTIDLNEELEDMVRRYIKEAGLEEKIDYRVGNALNIIPTLEGPFQLVFIDADKENYGAYFDMIIDKMPSGGFIVADNVLWSGKVLQPEERAKDIETAALHEFNEKINKDPRVENVLFPIRDGLMVIRKK